MITLFINNKQVLVPKGSSILEACTQLGIDIPRFCYHEKLSVAGNCRMCLVEIEKSPKPVAACAMPVAQNMVVFTESPLVKKARENVLEILLLNHPLDCPICDQGGECDLQDQTRIYGGDYSRFYILKRSVEDKYCGPLIKTIMTRCIHCTRCVRFATEIAGVDTLGTLNRGGETEIGSYIDRLINSEISGNVIDLCPVGALTSKPYAFTSRPWELRTTSSVDVLDCVGSNINVEYKESEIVRILPRHSASINEEWISDRIRFSYDALHRSRIVDLYIKKNNIFKVTDWEQTLELINKNLKSKKTLLLVNSTMDNSSLFFASKMQNQSKFRVRLIGSKGLDYNQYSIKKKIIDISKADSCYIIGTNPRLETPIINIRLRRQFLNGDFLITNIGAPYKSNTNTNFLSLHPNFLFQILSGKSNLQQIISINKTPLFFVGFNILQRINYNLIALNLKKLNYNSQTFFLNLKSNLRTSDFLNFQKLTQNDVDWAESVFILDVDDTFFLSKLISKIKCLKIWGNSHGSVLAEKSEIIVPLATFLEANYSYVNLDGCFQKLNKIFSGIKNIISTDAFLKYILQVKNTGALSLKSNLSDYETICNKENKSKFLTLLKKPVKLKVTMYPLKSNLEDFYLINRFTRASNVMGECSQAYRKESSNFN